MNSKLDSFTFVVISFNHEEYILEHLESIKYLVCEYAQDVSIDLVINDDCSTDKTVMLINGWLRLNSNLFRNVVTLYNDENIGTCQSVINTLGYVDSSAVKLTAGDDVYSFENIFSYSLLEDDVAIRSGFPVSLIKGVIFENKIETFNIVASEKIYNSRKLTDRFKYLSYNNAPNIIYNKNFLITPAVCDFLSEYDVVDDWPIQVAMSEQNPNKSFSLVDKVLVYYRRTSGSTYIVAKGRFYNDKIKLYDYLINNSSNLIEKFLIKNRRFLFVKRSPFLNKIINVAFYVYLANVVFFSKSIFSHLFNLNFCVNDHQKHYLYIVDQARRVEEKIS